MIVSVNGKDRQVTAGGTVDSLIREADLDPRFVIVEYNGEALDRARFADTTLSDGDRLELVKAVAGG